MHSLLASVLLLPVLGGPVPQSKEAEVAMIDALVKSLKPVMKTKCRYFGMLGKDIGQDGPWKEFASEKARDKAWDKYYLSENADVWSKNGAAVVVNIIYSEEDSGQVLTHFLRPDGSVAKVEAQFNSATSNYRVNRSMWFDGRGKLLKFNRSYTDFKNKPRPKPAAAGSYEGADAIFKLSRMPFYKLLIKR